MSAIPVEPAESEALPSGPGEARPPRARRKVAPLEPDAEEPPTAGSTRSRRRRAAAAPPADEGEG